MLTTFERLLDFYFEGSRSQELEFKYPHYLNRMFEKNTGCSPNEFRLSA
ncbi:hypothetical protein QET93_003450 [Akkermansia sp. N21116]|nr:hypothetical protein [Akkermansia sp. N21116]WPX41159.1 hypothetical protein QET93_003450 [Akkermansia sp. N21116]